MSRSPVPPAPPATARRAPPAPRRVLVVRLSHLGDVACTLTAYHGLRSLWPDAELAWACQPEHAGLLEGLDGLRVLPFDRRGGARAWLRLRAALRAFAAEVAVDAQGNWKSAAVAWLSRAPRRVGFARAEWREPSAAFLANDLAPATGASPPHLVDRVRGLVRHLGGPDEPRGDPALRDDELRRAARELDEQFGRPGAAPVLLHLSAPEDPRAWPPARVAELARALEAAGREHLLVSGPGERPLGERLRAELGETRLRRHLVGQRGVRALAATCAVLGRRGGRLVGADSGPVHVAWTAGLPVVYLGGPQAAARTGPWPPPGRADSPHRAVLAPEPPPCAPCLRRACHHPRGPVCMADLRAEDVLAALGPPPREAPVDEGRGARGAPGAPPTA